MRGPRKAFDGDDSEDRTAKRGHGGPSDSKLELESHSPKLVENLPLFRAVKAWASFLYPLCFLGKSGDNSFSNFWEWGGALGTMVRIEKWPLSFWGLGILHSPFLSPWDLGTTPPKINGWRRNWWSYAELAPHNPEWKLSWRAWRRPRSPSKGLIQYLWTT